MIGGVDIQQPPIDVERLETRGRIDGGTLLIEPSKILVRCSLPRRQPDRGLEMLLGGRDIAALCGDDAGEVLERRIVRVLLKGGVGSSFGAGKIVTLQP